MRAIFTNKHIYKLRRPLHIFMALAMILCTVFCNVVFADSYPFLPDINTVYVTGRQYNQFGGNADFFGSTNSDVYFFFHKPANSSFYSFYAASILDNCQYKYRSYANSSQALPDFSALSTGTLHSYNQNINGTTIYYYEIWSKEYSTYRNEDISVYSTLEDGLSAVIDYINNPPIPEVTYDFTSTVEVPSGSVLYIGIPSSGTLSMSMTTEMPMKTAFGSDNWTNVPQRVKQVNSLPSTGTTFPLTGSSQPNWTKTEPYNWLGQSEHAVTSTTTWSGGNGQFLTIYNPTYYMDGSIQAATNSLYVTISGYSSIKLYALQSDMSVATGQTGSSPSNYANSWDGESTDNGDGTGTVTWSKSDTSSDDFPDNPTPNQYNEGVSSSITEYIREINQTLSNFANSFIDLLKAPASHISQLINAGSEFTSRLGQLYTWLPDEVYATLTSGIILCIVIGVLKVLL